MVLYKINKVENVRYINARYVSFFNYNKRRNTTSIHMADESVFEIEGDWTGNVLEAMRRLDNLTVVSLGE